MPRPSWRRDSRYPPAVAIRSTASRSCGPQSQRWLPSASPVRHSLCGRTSGTGPRSASGVKGTARSPRPSAMFSRPSASPSKLKTRAGVANPSAKRRGTLTWVRIVATGSTGFIAAPSSVRPEPWRERIPQQYHVSDLANPGERGAALRVPGEAPVVDQPPGPGVADEERRDDQVQLVGQVGSQQLGQDPPAALDHQPAYAATVQVLAHAAEVER